MLFRRCVSGFQLIQFARDLSVNSKDLKFKLRLLREGRRNISFFLTIKFCSLVHLNLTLQVYTDEIRLLRETIKPTEAITRNSMYGLLVNTE